MSADLGLGVLGSGLTATSTAVLWIGLAVLFVGLALLLAVAFRALGRRTSEVQRQLAPYAVTVAAPAAAGGATPADSGALGDSKVARTAVEFADRIVTRRDLEGELEHRLESGGIPLKAPEWMIIHLGIAVVMGLLFLLLSGGGILAAAIGLLIGLTAPYGFLVIKADRRRAAFSNQLPDVLTLIAGSLRAGYSLPQSVDAVARDGTDPMAVEFNRALVETRLGEDITDALDGVAERMGSRDFHWVVEAIRIQRQVGGNLAELLLTVAATLRERERLRRQVRVLSAEGRLSAWIIGLLPLLFVVYLVLVQPNYLRPLYTTPLGIVMIIFGGGFMLLGILWLSRVTRVEV